jgi:hypothetical protein
LAIARAADPLSYFWLANLPSGINHDGSGFRILSRFF